MGAKEGISPPIQLFSSHELKNSSKRAQQAARVSVCPIYQEVHKSVFGGEGERGTGFTMKVSSFTYYDEGAGVK